MVLVSLWSLSAQRVEQGKNTAPYREQHMPSGEMWSMFHVHLLLFKPPFQLSRLHSRF